MARKAKPTTGKVPGGRNSQAATALPKSKAAEIRTKPLTAPEDSAVRESARKAFPIVGVGASAGGLEAFTELLQALPDNPGMGFVFVQHMAPTHESMLPQLLAKATSMPVREVTDGLRVESNQVYVIPPNVGMTIQNGVLRLVARKEGTGRVLPINDFLWSLAEDQKSAAIGIILSGTASDGAQGLKAIKAEGGITFAQDQDSARFAEMPLNAVATGAVDICLPPDKIALELARMGRHPYLGAAKEPPPPRLAETPDDTLRRICLVLRTATGVDFELYRPATIARRVGRRMAVLRMNSRDKYLHFLRENQAEVDALYEDIFIHVTGFFRDVDELLAVRQMVLPRILESQPQEPAIRVWVPGCSTGEEVFSIAILLVEELGNRTNRARIQIFGTDVAPKAIDTARAGIYPESSIVHVSAERRRRFFVKVEKGYQIAKFVRDMCIFARHDLTKDPPFSKLDLISCRNVLIYFGPTLQKRAAEIFHYALKPSGCLLLGKAESLSGHSHLFSSEDPKFKIFGRRPSPAPLYVTPTTAEHVRPDRTGRPAPLSPPLPLPLQPVHDFGREVERILLDQFVPAAVVVDSELQIVHFQGNTSRFLSPATGQPNFHLLRMVRPELMVEIRTALHEAKKCGATVRREAIRLNDDGSFRLVDVQVSPIKGRRAKDGDFLVVFHDTPGSALVGHDRSKSSRTVKRKPESPEIAQLTRDLEAAHAQLKSLIEDHEATTEEMTAVNEEIISGNEELQSTNEELETAKEELQSSNEELTTLNDELQNRNAELGRVANDLRNLLVSVEIPIVILDGDLRIRRFTPMAEKVLHLIAADAGRPFTDLATPLDVADWKELADQVVQQQRVVERDVQDRKGHWYCLRMRPYQSEHKIDGILMSLVDIDAVKRSLDEAQQARDFAEAIVETVREPLLILDAELRVLKATQVFYEVFRTSVAETEGQNFFDLAGGTWKIPALRDALLQILPQHARLDSFEVAREFPALGYRYMILNARRIEPQSREKPMILLAMEDVTERRRAEELMRQRDRVIQEAISQAIVSTRSDGRIVMANFRAAEMFGYNREELLDLPLERLLPEPVGEERRTRRSEYLTAPQDRPIGAGMELTARRKDGTEFPVSMNLSHVETKDGRLAIEIITDLTERKQAEEALQLSQERLLLAQEVAGIGLWDWDATTDEVLHSREWGPLYGLPPGAQVDTHQEWLTLIHPEDLERVRDNRKRALENGEPYNPEFRTVWPDGSVHWLQGRATVFRDADGKAVRMVGATVDITSRKQAEVERQAVADRLAAAQEEERRRISRELHDDLTQRLAGLAMELGSLTADFPTVPERLKKRLRSAQGGLVQAAEAARHVAHELHPSEIEDLGLAAALGNYCEDFGRRETIAVTFTSRNLPEAINREIASCLFKVTQESLRNIAKHANTQEALVTLEGTGDRVRLRVEDRGVGFTVSSLSTNVGLGISSMKERVRLMSGRFTVQSQLDHGTQIEVELPLSGRR